jgi:hypothetical protein
MKLSDVVTQLQLVLPKYTDLFSETLAIVSISATVDTATIVTSVPHRLNNSDGATLTDVATETAISAVSKSGLVFTFTTATDHDLTEGWPEHEFVELSGFTDPLWNGSFTLVDVPNRRTFKVQSTNTLPVLNTNEILEEVRMDGVNGRFGVTVVNSTTFEITGTFLAANYTGGNVRTAVRIAGAVTQERALNQYTEMQTEEMWMFVVMHDAETSKDRKTFNDAQATIPSGTELRMRLLDGFDLILIKNTTQEAAAVDAVDTVRHTLQLPILKSVYGVRFDTGLSGAGDFKTVLLGHGFISYNEAILVYGYSFQSIFDLTDNDAVVPADTKAFRDIAYEHEVGGADTETMTVGINTDEEPL